MYLCLLLVIRQLPRRTHHQSPDELAEELLHLPCLQFEPMPLQNVSCRDLALSAFQSLISTHLLSLH